MLGPDHAADVAVGVAERVSDGELAAALQRVAQHDDAEASRAEQHPEPAEELKDSEVGVLDRLEGGEPVGGRRQLQPEVRQRVAEVVGYGVTPRCRRVDQEHAEARRGREARAHVAVGDQQVALQDRVGDGADDANFELVASLVAVGQRVADLLLQRPRDAAAVADRGHDLRSEVAVEQLPAVAGPPAVDSAREAKGAASVELRGRDAY